MEKAPLSPQHAIIVHHEEIRRRIKARYSLTDIRELQAFLEQRGTVTFKPLTTGLYPAAGIDPAAAALSGYGNVWVRDNVYVALAHESAGLTDLARTAIESLASFYLKYRSRFELIVNGQADPSVPMNRPQVRFDGVNLSEISTGWSHAQNDALGYFLWMYCRLAASGHLIPNAELLVLFALYFEAIRYWEDEDSGHWEERRKVEASSIGAVVAGLRALRPLAAKGMLSGCQFGSRIVALDDLDRLIGAGDQALTSILPSECIQPDPKKRRRYDSALLFLAYPLNVINDSVGQQIVNGIVDHHEGEHGIRRYLGDSYWTADYKDKLAREALTADVSEHQEERDALAKPGEEAQWCIFDPIISIIAGRRYLFTGDPIDLERQTRHLNRSLGQITGPGCPQGEMRCPEAYYLEHGSYVPNDHVPLLWTQANLWLALLAMEKSAAP
jgi:phosphorylase kinase alpha/beta subunit